jgi:hypothetical protein
MIIKMAKKLNARELDEKELAETKGGSILLTILTIGSLIYIYKHSIAPVIEIFRENPLI